MFNEAQISLSGYIATQPVMRTTRTGIPSVSMRVAWTPRRLDRVTGEWIDAGTSFLSVVTYKRLAENIATCMRKGDPVVVRGRVSIREFEDKNGAQRTVVEVDASSVGHDLSHGVATFSRIRPQTGLTALEYQAAEGLPGTDEQDSDGADTQLSGEGIAVSVGPDGAASRDGAAGFAAEADRPDRAGDDMFDETAVAALAQDAATVAVPF
jgi:single-strand DNA-binding protein